MYIHIDIGRAIIAFLILALAVFIVSVSGQCR